MEKEVGKFFKALLEEGALNELVGVAGRGGGGRGAGGGGGRGGGQGRGDGRGRS